MLCCVMLDCGSLIHLRHGAYRATVAPAAGGRVASLTFGAERRPLLVDLREASFPALQWPKAGAFPMLPYANRMPVDGIRVGERVVRPVDAPGGGQHGFGHRSAWEVAACSDHHVEMHLAADACSSEWPWPLSACQRLTLSCSGLRVEIEVRNEGSEPMPLAMGWHPYVAMASSPSPAMVSFVARSRFEIDAVGRAVPSDRAAPSFGMERGETAAFGGWTGPVQVQAHGGLQVTLFSEGADCLVLHRPHAGDYLCVEPVTELPGCVGQPGPDRKWLVLPGETRRMAVTCGVAGGRSHSHG